MSDFIVEKNWTRWYPKKIFLKNIKRNKKFTYHLNNFTEQDISKNRKNDIEDKETKKVSELEINLLKKTAYNIGFKEGMLKNQKENILLSNKINNLFLDFNNSLTMFENVLFSRLLKTVLIVSSYVIGKNTDIDESILLKYMKRIIDRDGLFLKNPKLLIHPDNKKLIEKILKDSLNIHKWELIYDNKIDLNSCKVTSESGDMDATIDARWQELCRFVNEKEC